MIQRHIVNPPSPIATIRTVNGRPMVWRGEKGGKLHYCEAANLVRNDPRTYAVWTLCGEVRVPRVGARAMRDDEQVDCPECIEAARNI